MVVTAINNIIYGGAIENAITKDAETLGSFILERLDAIADRPILVDGLTGLEVTAKQFKQTVIDFARNLRALGIKEGDKVGICSENRMEFAYCMFGTLMLNATLAPYNVTYTEREFKHAFGLSKPRIIFASSSTIDKVAKVTRQSSFVRIRVCFDDRPLPKGVIPYSKFTNHSNREQHKGQFKPKPTNVEESVVVILCSSGTTGLPKGAQLTQRNIMHVLDVQHERTGTLSIATFLSVIPFFHAYGFLTLITILSRGARLVFLPRFQEHYFLNCIQHYSVDACLTVPSLILFLAKHPMVEKYDLSSLKILLCGAAPLKTETAEAVQKRLGVLVKQGYGMSESLNLLLPNQKHKKPGSVGSPSKGVQVKIIDTETGRPLGPNQCGELCFKSNTTMKSYVGNKQATDELIDKDGWLHTGDIGYYDDDFDFFVVDRMKELIKYKGHQVAPAELEGLLVSNPKIKDVAVIGIPDEASGELPMAFIVQETNAELTEKEVMKFVAERVSPIKKLRGGVRFIDEIPRNASGKILHRVLRDKIKKESKSKL